jgi:hypothetical protein
VLTQSQSVRRALLVAAGVLIIMMVGARTAAANTVAMTSCLPGNTLPQPPWASASTASSTLTPGVNCASGGRLQLSISPSQVVPVGAYEQWRTVVPAAMSLRAFGFPAQAALLSTTLTNHLGGGSSGFNARFLTAAGSVTFIDDNQFCCGGMDYARPGSWPIAGQYFILDVNCSVSVEPPSGGCAEGSLDSHDLLDIKDFTLIAEDDQPPAISAPPSAPGGGRNLWSAGQWVRGLFNLAFTASNTTGSGVCNTSAKLDGQQLPAPAGAFSNPNTALWQQCPGAYLWQQAVNTSSYPNGPGALALAAADAASPQNTSTPTKTIGIDNAPVTLALSGPADVAASPANASAEVTATASAGPSGVNIFCSVDGGPQVEYPGASAQVPVSGIGPHTASCFGQNNAADANGVPARSTTQTYSLTIRQPTAEAITFAHIADALRCRRVVEEVKVRGKTRVVKRHGKKILIRGRARIVRRHVQRCHARTVKRKVWVTLKHHGKVVRRHGKPIRVRRVKRVIVLPHTIFKAKRRIGHAKTTTVSGYLGLPDGTPLAGRAVSVIAAPDNGLGQFTLPIATVTTTPSGIWTAKVPAGPSRLIEAVYAGSATDEPATSAPVMLSVPAQIKLAIAPRIVPWDAAIHIRGRLVGGYVPPDGVALRLLVRYPHLARKTPLQALRTDGRGRFAFSWSYHAGRGVVTYPFSVATTASESDYPFAGSASRAIRVIFGRATPPPPARHHKHRA